ncbi:hypothetical protein TFLX_05181 [Thermoflexales bacterium]|nr:hypothetical protein TFLX_05181 [Thermoflexales bacterium]
MTDDPVVQILREAAAIGRQLRLAREQAAQNGTRPDETPGVIPDDQAADIAVPPEQGTDTIGKESSA